MRLQSFPVIAGGRAQGSPLTRLTRSRMLSILVANVCDRRSVRSIATSTRCSTCPGLKNVDMTIARNFKLGERKSLQFRGESTNALNLVNLSNPGTNANSASTFGNITTGRAMRQAQLGLKLVF